MMYIQLICLVCIQEDGNERNRIKYRSSIKHHQFKSTMITLYVAQTSIQTYSSRAHLVFMYFIYLEECHGMRYEAKFSLKFFSQVCHQLYFQYAITFISGVSLSLPLVCYYIYLQYVITFISSISQTLSHYVTTFIASILLPLFLVFYQLYLIMSLPISNIPLPLFLVFYQLYLQ